MDYKLDDSLCICTEKNVGDAKVQDWPGFTLLNLQETYYDAELYYVEKEEPTKAKAGNDFVLFVSKYQRVIWSSKNGIESLSIIIVH